MNPAPVAPPVTALDVDTALARARAAAMPVTATECLPLHQAVGRILAQSPLSLSDLPPFDGAAMDGFALRHADLGQLATGLPLHSLILAGTDPAPLPAGHAMRIMTGAPVPAGADCVIRQEDVTAHGAMLRWSGDIPPVSPFHNIRSRGEDLPLGAAVLPAGVLLTPERLALLAGAGHGSVTVRCKLRVGLFSTGNELVEPGGPRGAAQIFNTNRVMLAAALALPWITLTDYAILPDDPAALRTGLARAAAENDVVLTSGGMSVGTADHMLDVLGAEGAELAVLKIAMRPGKPLAVARLGASLFIGLPGNPFAALVTFGQIAMPTLRHAAGASETPDRLIACTAGFTYHRSGQRREYLPVTWDSRDATGRPVIAMLGKGASARLAPVAKAKGIAILSENHRDIAQGDLVMVDPLWR